MGTTARRTLHAALVALVVASALAGCLATPGDTARITLVSSVTQAGWRYDYYRNDAYPCSVSGSQTFVLATKVGSDAGAPEPLWVRVHGGGVGYFDSTGAPRPATHKAQESRASLIARLQGGLTEDVRAAPEGFRALAVSMCSHDLYAGTNTPDPNNPNTLPDGTPRTTNGLLATKAAIQYATGLHPTDDLFLHGGSAGSAGSLHLAWALQRQGIAPAGVVADAGILNRTWEAAQIELGTPCAMTAEAAETVPLRFDPEVRAVGNQPDLLVADGRLAVPIAHVWNRGDPNVCGATPMQCELRDGTVVTLGSADCVHEPLRLAIAAQGPTSRSVNLGLCVDDPSRAGACDKHVVTTSDDLVNSAPGIPADYNAVLLAWVRDRLADDAT